MASNSFGQVFRITTWGESHGPAVGVLIDGCPSGVAVDEALLNSALARRRPGMNYTSPRKEEDTAQILSGVYEGQTTGAPISIVIWNRDVDSSKYTPIKEVYRPGHAQFTYLEKYGCFDYRGGGRSSARETACRVAAGAIAEKILSDADVHCTSYLSDLGGLFSSPDLSDLNRLRQSICPGHLFCPDSLSLTAWQGALENALAQGDSLGGVVEAWAWGLPVGLGDPVYEKLEARLAQAMLSIPASKGFEIGEGFQAATMRGSTHNDGFGSEGSLIRPSSNNAGGTLGGISTGLPIRIRVPFKPTSSIGLPQESVDFEGKPCAFELPKGSRHDPCVAIRAVPVVQAMLSLVLVDAWLMQRLARVSSGQKTLDLPGAFT